MIDLSRQPRYAPEVVAEMPLTPALKIVKGELARRIASAQETNAGR